MKRLPLYPFFLAAAPVLALWADNARETEPADLVRPLLMVLALAGLVMLATWPLVKQFRKAGPPAVCVLIFFLAFGPVVRLLPSIRMLYFLPAWTALWSGGYVFAVIRLRRTSRPLIRLTGMLNLLAVAVALAPVAIQVPKWLDHGGPTHATPATAPHSATQAATQPAPAADSLPDIYYLILDGYSRQDMLASRFGLDNSPFIDALRQRGFFVGDRSHANYMHSHLSLAATLNMEYLDEYLDELGPVEESKDGWYDAAGFFQPLIADCRVRRELEWRGYRTVGLGTAYNITRGFNERAGWLSMGINEFEMVLLQQTVLAPILEHLAPMDLTPHDMQRERIKYIFGQLPVIARQKGSKFVFVHIVCPHRPFVFRADGRPQPRNDQFEDLRWWPEAIQTPGFLDWYRQYYPQQIQGLNRLVLEAIDQILAASARPPILIIQGDHGSSLGLRFDPAQCDVQDRLGILNAIYLPDGQTETIDPGLTSVNTFRLVLSRLFGMDLPPLKDHAYFSAMGTALTDVTDRVRRKD